MIKHVVMWRLQENAHGNGKAKNALLIKQKLEALRGQIPGLLSIEVGVDFSATADSSDIVLYSEFQSAEALQQYQTHPLHMEIMPFVMGARQERRIVDYEV
jgi:Stress responsive A/B Barrel Domain